LLVEISSYSHASDVLKFDWDEEIPIQLKRGFHDSLHLFELQQVNTGYCKSRTGEYSCLKIELILKRFYQTYVLGIYVPSIFFVVIGLMPYLMKNRINFNAFNFEFDFDFRNDFFDFDRVQQFYSSPNCI